MRSVRRVVVALVLGLVPPVLVAATHVPRARAQGGDLKTNTDSTTKDGTGGGSTGKDLSTGSPTELTTGPVKPKPKPSATTSATASDTASAEPSDSATAPTPPSSASIQPFTRRSVPLEVGDFAVALRAPGNWPEMKDDELPTVDLSAAPEASISVRRGFGWHSPDAKTPRVAEVVIVCAKAPAEGWGDNIRDAAFTSMVQGVEKDAQEFTDLKSIEPDPIHTEGDRIVQPFHAWANFTHDGEKADVLPAGEKDTGKPAAWRVQLQGVSFVGFKAESGDARTLVACTIACAHLVKSGDKGMCPDIVQTIEVSGSFASAPKRSWIAEMVFAFKKDKTTGILILVGAVVGLALVGVLLATLLKKKKQPIAAAAGTPTGAHDAASDEDEFQAGYEAGLAAARSAVAQPAPAASPTSSASPSPASSSSTNGSPLHASPPPPQGYFDPTTLQPR